MVIQERGEDRLERRKGSALRVWDSYRFADCVLGVDLLAVRVHFLLVEHGEV